MSMDRSGPSHGGVNTGQTTDSIADTEGSLFAATPIWERRGKKRGRPRASGSDTPSGLQEPRSFGSDPLDAPIASTGAAAAAGPDPLDAPLISAPGESAAAEIAAGEQRPHLHAQDGDGRLERRDVLHDDEDREIAAPPIRRERAAASRTAKRGGPPAAAIALGVLALGGLGLAGVYALQGDDGVPELTPGVEGAGPVAALPPMTEGAAVASRSAAPAMAEPVRAAPITPAAEPERRTTRMASTTARTRPATTSSAPSATDAGIPASGTAALPGAPQPYGSLNPDARATTPPPAQSTAPTTVNPAPAAPVTPPVSEETPSTAPAQTPPDTTSEPPPQA